MLKKIHKLKYSINSYSLLVFIITTIALTVYAFFPLDTQAALRPLNYILFAILAVSGFILFWQKKELMEVVLDQEKKGEKTAQDKREKTFPVKFPILNRIPLFRYLFRWVYKEGWAYVAIFALLLLLAFVLRVMDLTVLEPYDDAYSHLMVSLAIVDHGTPTVFVYGEYLTTLYTRFLFLTYLIAYLFFIFGKSLFIARLPGVIIGTLTAIPFYFIGRKINKKIGLIMAAIWVFSPWAIAISKNIREYAYFPFLYLFIGLFLIFFAKHLIQIIEKGDFKITFKRIISSAVFFLPFLYYFSDPKSTFMLAFILYAVFFAVLFYGVFRSKKLTRQIKKKIGVFLLIPVSIFAVIAYSNIGSLFEKHASIVPHFNRYWFDLILGNSDTTFFYEANNYGFYIFFGLAILFSIYRFIKNKSLTSIFLLLAFFGYFYFYSFHFVFSSHPRYAFVLHVWLIPLVAIGIYLLYKFFLYKQNKAKKIFISFFLSVFLLTVFSPKNIYMAIDQSDYYDKKWPYAFATREYHDRFIPFLEKYDDQIHADDVIICSLCGPFYWHEKVDFVKNNVFYYNFRDPKRIERAAKIISYFPEGWMILDRRRNTLNSGFPKKDFYRENKTIEFIDQYSDFYIYRWYVK